MLGIFSKRLRFLLAILLVVDTTGSKMSPY
jgi:hypothetical protein